MMAAEACVPGTFSWEVKSSNMLHVHLRRTTSAILKRLSEPGCASNWQRIFPSSPHPRIPTLFNTLTCPHFLPLLLRRDIVKSALEARRRQDRSLDEAAAAITASR